MPHGRFLDGRIIGRIVVPGYEIHVFCPHLIIQIGKRSHQVCRNRNIRRDGVEGVIFQPVAVQDAFGIKTPVIQRNTLKSRSVRRKMLG